MDSNNKHVEFMGKGQNKQKVEDMKQASNIKLKTTTSENFSADSLTAVIYKATMVNPTSNTKQLMQSRRICFDLDQE